MKIVKNSCFGGFGLSIEASREFLKRKGKQMFVYKQVKYEHSDGIEEWEKIDNVENKDMFVSILTVDLGDKFEKLKYKEGEYFMDSDIKRDDTDLIAVIEKLGSGKSSGSCASLEIIEIPDGIEYEIDEYDGAETIREKHRSW